MQHASSTVAQYPGMVSLKTGAEGTLHDQETINDMEGVKKVLVIGPSNSGKSTVIKRLQLLVEGQGLTVLARYKPQIIGNVVEVAHAVANYLDNLGSPSDQDLCWLRQLRRELDRLGSSPQPPSHVPTELADVLYHSVWNTSAGTTLQAETIDGIRFPVSALYFVENILRIGRNGYEPTVPDVLRAWTEVGNNATHPIQPTFLEDLGVLLLETRIIDPPALGMDHLLQNVDPDVVIFVVPLASYDDRDVFDELIDFHKTLDERLSANTSIILLFNQLDMFAHRVATIPLCTVYTVPTDRDLTNPTEAAGCIAGMFLTGRRERRNIFISFADATTFMEDHEILELVVG